MIARLRAQLSALADYAFAVGLGVAACLIEGRTGGPMCTKDTPEPPPRADVPRDPDDAGQVVQP